MKTNCVYGIAWEYHNITLYQEYIKRKYVFHNKPLQNNAACHSKALLKTNEKTFIDTSADHEAASGSYSGCVHNAGKQGLP